MGVSLANLPVPLIVNVGGVLYSYPLLVIKTCSILPLLTMGRSSASLPVSNLNNGCLLWLIISLDPYPTPLLVNCTDSTDPLTIGWIFALKSCPVKVVTPICPSTITEIDG